jgi:hypothetical protein
MRYAKFVTAAAGAAAVAIQAAVTDGVITTQEWAAIGIAALTAAIVLLVPNKPAEDDSVRYLREHR